MSNSASVSALSEWDRPGNDNPLAKLSDKQSEILTDVETYMDGKRCFKEVRIQNAFINRGISIHSTNNP